MPFLRHWITLTFTGVLTTLVGSLPAYASDAANVAGFDLGPEQAGQLRADPVPQAIAALPEDYQYANPGALTVALAPAGPPITTYATDAVTIIGADPDIAQVVADALDVRLDVVAIAWEDWPLGLHSGKYDAVIANVGVTEERKEKFDFSSYRQGLHGFFVPADSTIEKISEAADLAGLRVLVSPGTNQDAILQRWSHENVAAGLAPIDLQFFDDEATRLVALQSGRADVIVQPHAQLVFIAARDSNIKRVGVLSAGWPDRSDVAIATRKGSGLAEPLTIALNALIENGTYERVLARWQLEAEALPHAETNPPGRPKY